MCLTEFQSCQHIVEEIAVENPALSHSRRVPEKYNGSYADPPRRERPINVVEHSKPVKLSEFDGWLRTRGAELVYSLVNIRRLAAPLALGSSFLPQVKDSLDRLECLPHCFVTSGIDLLELRRALDCFEAGKEYVAINPYVPRFDYVFPPFAKSAKLYYPMRESVVDLWRACPNLFQPQPKYHKLQALGISMDRDRMAARQSSSEPPSEWIVEILTLKMKVAEERATQIASWISANPFRCPAMWLTRAVGFSMSQNQSYAARKDDTFDMAEMWTIAYTDADTVDRCMRDLFSRAMRNLGRKDGSWSSRQSVQEFERTDGCGEFRGGCRNKWVKDRKCFHYMLSKRDQN
jgi:hypothetical protein